MSEPKSPLEAHIHNEVINKTQNYSFLESYHMLGDQTANRITRNVVTEMQDPAINGLLQRIAESTKEQAEITKKFEAAGLEVRVGSTFVPYKDTSDGLSNPTRQLAGVNKLTTATLHSPKDTRTVRLANEKLDTQMDMDPAVKAKLKEAFDFGEEAKRSVQLLVQRDMRADVGLKLETASTVASTADIMINIATQRPELLPALAKAPEKTAEKPAPEKPITVKLDQPDTALATGTLPTPPLPSAAMPAGVRPSPQGGRGGASPN